MKPAKIFAKTDFFTDFEPFFGNELFSDIFMEISSGNILYLHNAIIQSRAPKFSV